MTELRVSARHSPCAPALYDHHRGQRIQLAVAQQRVRPRLAHRGRDVLGLESAEGHRGGTALSQLRASRILIVVAGLDF